jgi:hypothetical protein
MKVVAFLDDKSPAELIRELLDRELIRARRDPDFETVLRIQMRRTAERLAVGSGEVIQLSQRNASA